MFSTALSLSSAICGVNFVDKITLSRSIPLTNFPKIASESPSLYTAAVSQRFKPNSIPLLKIGSKSLAVKLLPKTLLADLLSPQAQVPKAILGIFKSSCIKFIYYFSCDFLILYRK